MKKELYETYVQVLKDELLPAMGCTEPIAVAYAGAVVRQTLGNIPERVEIQVSRNIIKNVKSVIVPHTGGLRGIEAAAAIGIVAGDAKAQLEVISSVTEEQIRQTRDYLAKASLHVDFAKSDLIFDICITAYHGEDQAFVRIVDYHTNIVTIRRNDQVLLSGEITGRTESSMADKSLLTIRDICEFADIVNIEDVREVLDRQISYNMAIAMEGMKNSYGANIGKVLMHTYGTESAKIKAKAMAAAGSDARMNGCELPVVINSGSGNQGITASVPVIVYAKELNAGEEKMYRALALSNLTTIHQKTPIGRLSAFCGAVSAGAGAGAGIAYLNGGDFDAVIHTVVNALAVISGMVCDGAKASCAAKIAESVDAAILGYNMYVKGQQFYGGDGIVKKGVENTIQNVGRLAKDGMKKTNEEIISIMIEC